MLNWQFSELIKEPKHFAEDVDCQIVIDERYDILTIDSCHVSGNIQFDGQEGDITFTINLTATILAANTGEPVTFSDTLKITEDFNLSTDEYVDSERNRIELLPYIYSMVDVMIPLYFNDESKQLVKTSDKHWKLIDETTYFANTDKEEPKIGLANLSNVVSKKSN